MKFTVLVSSSIIGIALAAPLPQYGEPWAGFFGPELEYSPYLENPYFMQPRVPGGQPSYNPNALPPLSSFEAPYTPPQEDRDPPAPGPLDTVTDQEATAPTQPHPTPLVTKPKISKPVSEKPSDKKPLAEKLSSGFKDAPAPGPAHVDLAAKPVVKEDDSNGEFDKDAIRYHVNVGGVQKGGNGGTTNFHVFSDENGNKHFSDELDDETEKYITENMIPKLGGKRRGVAQGGVWSVFGDK